MTIATTSFILGAVLLLAGILGGGFEVKDLKIPRISGISRAVAIAAGGLFVVIGFMAAPESRKSVHRVAMSSMEWNVDRTYMSYSNFDLTEDDPKACQEACRDDPACKAWTYVRPHTIQGDKPRCWLKNVVPAPTPATCCVSGTKLE